jgi:hypothetical protein
VSATLDEAIVDAAEAMRDRVDATIEQAGAIPEPRPIEVLLVDPEVSEDIAAGDLLCSVPLVRHSGRPAKANLSIDSGILAAIDAEAKRRKLTRSAFIELMARHALPEMALSGARTSSVQPPRRKTLAREIKHPRVSISPTLAESVAKAGPPAVPARRGNLPIPRASAPSPAHY